MVRAILEGRKTQTRRVVKPQPKVVHALYPDCSIETNCIFRKGDQRIHAPYRVGTRLWVRETWYSTPDKQSLLGYAADGDIPHGVVYRRRPSIFMPRRLSRINLLVTHVRCQQIQDITEEDAIAEGVDASTFPLLWDAINEKRGFPWASNPWVWVYTFSRILE